MIVCMYRKYDKDKNNHNKVEACVAFALRHILESCPQARSFLSFFLLGKGRLSKLLTRRIGTFGS